MESTQICTIISTRPVKYSSICLAPELFEYIIHLCVIFQQLKCFSSRRSPNQIKVEH